MNKVVLTPVNQLNADQAAKVHQLEVAGASEGQFAIEAVAFIDTVAKAAERADFHSWFSRSVVRTTEGRPLLVYHGTDADFSKFDLSRSGEGSGSQGWLGHGIYFTDRVSSAAFYGSKIKTAYLNMSNPAVFTSDLIADILKLGLSNLRMKGCQFTFGEVIATRTQIKEAIQGASMDRWPGSNEGFTNFEIEYGGQSFVLRNISSLELSEGEAFLEKLFVRKILREHFEMPDIEGHGSIGRMIDPIMLSDALKKNGYDGIIANGTNFFDFNAKEYVVFDSEQIHVVDDPDQAVRFQRVWHGSPHEFDRFTQEKIGSGVGLNSFGYGIYFSDYKDVAEFHRKELSPLFFEGKSLASVIANAHLTKLSQDQIDALIAVQSAGTVADALQAGNGLSVAARSWLEQHCHLLTSGGQLYEAEVPDIEEYLQWDKPLFQQSDYVKKAVKELLRDVSDDLLVQKAHRAILLKNPEMTGEWLYKSLAETAYANEQVTSMELDMVGIAGIVYRDGGLVQGSEEAINFVVFNEAKIAIEKKHIQKNKRETAGMLRMRWLNDTKIVGEDGLPLMVVHGSNHVIDQFDPTKTLDGGVHFGTVDQANMRSAGNGKNLIPVYLNIVNPRRCKDGGSDWKKKIQSAKKAGYDGIVYLNRYEGITTERINQLSASGMLNKLDSLSDKEFKKYVPEARDSYVAFEKMQIRSIFEFEDRPLPKRLAMENVNVAANVLGHPGAYPIALSALTSWFSSAEKAKQKLDAYRVDVDRINASGGKVYQLVFAESASEILLDQVNVGRHWSVDENTLIDITDKEAAFLSNGLHPFVVVADLPPQSVSNAHIDLNNNADALMVNVLASVVPHALQAYAYDFKTLGEWVAVPGAYSRELDCRDDLVFRDECTDAYSGQSNMRLTATLDGGLVGHVDYVIFNDEVSISMVYVNEEFRRQGIGAALVLHLQSLFPETEIRWGMLTENGAYLYDSLPRCVFPVQDVIEQRRLLKEHIVERNRLCAIADAFDAKKDVNEEDRLSVIRQLESLNQLHDEIEMLTENLHGRSATKVLMRGGNPFVKVPTVDDDLTALVDRWAAKGVKVGCFLTSTGYIYLDTVIVPVDRRERGLGSEFMSELVKVADTRQLTVALTASTDYEASSLSRLKRFYKRFGFQENKGRHKDYQVSVTANMVRQPERAPENKFLRADGSCQVSWTGQQDMTLISDLANMFGAHVAVFRQTKDSRFKFNGVKSGDTIWLNEASQKPLHVVFGHELLHRMRDDRPGLYGRIQAAIKPLLKKEDLYADLVGLQGKTSDYLQEEMIADLLGDRFAEPAFWQAVQDHDRSLCQSLSEYVGNMIGRVKALFSDQSVDTLMSSQFVSDLDAARAILAKAVAEYVQGEKRKHALPQSGFFESFRSVVHQWMSPPAVDKRKMSAFLAEDIDEKLMSIYQATTGLSPDYENVFAWVLGAAADSRLSADVHQQLQDVACQRGFVIDEDARNTSVTLTPAGVASQPTVCHDVDCCDDVKNAGWNGVNGVELN